jgi:hypothetical protein
LPATTTVSHEASARIPESLMPARLPGSGWAPRAALLAALLPLLADCGPARNQFAPACPGTAILGDAADFSAYRASNAPGGGRDLTDLVLQARVSGIGGTCKPGDDKSHLAVAVSISIDLARGPAMTGRQADVPIFMAVVQGDTVLDKHVYLMRAVFPANVDRVTLTPGEVDLSLPITPEKSGASYTILAGFQLTPEQLRQNQRGGG